MHSLRLRNFPSNIKSLKKSLEDKQKTRQDSFCYSFDSKQNCC